MEMLDLGVDAGRTAWHFAPQARSYLGLDYARTMVERRQHDLPAYRFIVGDASDLDFAADNSYDCSATMGSIISSCPTASARWRR